ncbi:hypothetical protein [Ralstonia sp.]|uniref:hypothetical protein n=1 Tax=Ralstonia sp. TaxID=54061 RepID=UPI0031D3D1C6
MSGLDGLRPKGACTIFSMAAGPLECGVTIPSVDMQITDILLGLTPTVLFAAALWLGRSLIITRLKSAVQHEFDQKIEAVRSEQRISEESFKAVIRQREADIASLKSSAIAGIASTQLELYKRRLAATEQLWSAVSTLAGAKAAVQYIAIFRMDAIASHVESDKKLRELFEFLLTPIGGLEKYAVPDATKAQPFVSELAWSLFYAYQSILMLSVSQLHLLKNGIDPRQALSDDAVGKIAKIALPHWAQYIDQHGLASYPTLVEELQKALLAELRRMLTGAEADAQSVARAHAIQQQVTKINEESEAAAVNIKLKAAGE